MLVIILLLAGLASASTYLCLIHHWRRAVALLAIWMVLEDLVRKLLPGQPPPVILGKDAILAGIYGVSILGWQGKVLYWPNFMLPLALFAAVVLAGCFGPEVPSPLFALAGLRSYLWYVPVFWIGYCFANTKKDVYRVARTLTVLALVLVPLAVLVRQGVIAPEGPFGVFEGGHQHHAFDDPAYGNILLSSSVFGQNARFGRLSLAIFFLAFGWLTGPGSVDWRWWLAALVGAVGVMASANRGTIYAMGIGAAILAARPFFARTRTLAVGRMATLGAALVLIVSSYLSDVLYFVHKTSYEPVNRLEWMRTDIAHAAEKSGFWGHGTGTCSQGISYLPGWEVYASEYNLVGAEQGFAKIIWELGYVGLAAHLLLWGSVAIGCFRLARQVSGTELDGPAWGAFTYLIGILGISMLGHQVLGDGHVVIMLWFLLGMLHRMPALMYRQEKLSLFQPAFGRRDGSDGPCS